MGIQTGVCTSGQGFFFGTSQGGGAALLLGSVFNDITRATASDEPFLTNIEMAAGRGAYGLGASLYKDTPKETVERGKYLIDTVHHLHRYCFPILLTSGGRDENCPPETIENLFYSLKEQNLTLIFHIWIMGITENLYSW